MFGFFLRLFLIWLVVMIVLSMFTGWYASIENSYRWMLPN